MPPCTTIRSRAKTRALPTCSSPRRPRPCGPRPASSRQPTSSPRDRFGAAVSVAYEQIVVGAPGRNEGKGAAYIARIPDEGTIPTLTPLIPSTELAPNAAFGSAIGSPFTGDSIAFVGAPRDNNGEGAVHVFNGQSMPPWSVSARLTATEGAPGDQFGAAVAADDQHLAVTAPRSPLASAGAVYIFEPRGGLEDGATCRDDAECAGRFCVASRCCTHDCASLYGCTTAEDPSGPPRPLPDLALLGCGALALALRKRRAS